MTINTCKYCGSSLAQAEANFCPKCGKALDTTLKVKRLVGAVLGLLVGTSVWWFHQTQIGVKPTQEFKTRPHSSSQAMQALFREDDGELQKLRAAVVQGDSELEALKGLAEALEQYYFQYVPGKDKIPSELALEYLRTLTKIVELDPAQHEVVLKLAQVAFENKVFDKSTILYERYLKQFPQNHDVRAKYASALAFTGKLEESRAQLGQVLAQDPNHFQANAFMAIAYAQVEDNQKALEYAEIALQHAPHEEARKRFEVFVRKLRPNESDGIEEYLRENTITKSKFERLEQADGSIRLFFSNFPMSAMPPVAKAKFFGEIRSRARTEQVSLIEFVDSETNQVMETLTIDK